LKKGQTALGFGQEYHPDVVLAQVLTETGMRQIAGEVNHTITSSSPVAIAAAGDWTWRFLPRIGWIVATLGLSIPGILAQRDSLPAFVAPQPSLVYTNYFFAQVPWSIHLIQLPRTPAEFAWHALHAGGGALGFSGISTQIAAMPPGLGTPIAAVNGDFYQRDKAYAGHPRGLQIANGELLSGPSGGVVFWIDAAGHPHATNVVSRFAITWPDGTVTPFDLNGERRTNGVQLYTPAIGRSTRTTGGRELILEPTDPTGSIPLQVAHSYQARIRRIRPGGNTRLPRGALVLSLGPAIADRIPRVQTGMTLGISTATLPSLTGVTTAIGGGPLLVHAGKPQPIPLANTNAFEFTSMRERHPRAAIGWNDSSFVLAEVDGRQKGLSAGMTLPEFSRFLAGIGCRESMNLDGGGSATLWYNGRVRNRPCDGHERGIANCLVVVRKVCNAGTTNAVNMN
jgi:large repetitive protein